MKGGTSSEALLSNHSKVLVYLNGHEHNYYRLLVTNTTPVEVPKVDGVDGDRVLDSTHPTLGSGTPCGR